MRIVFVILTAVAVAAIAVVTVLSIVTQPFYDFHTAGLTMVLFTAGLWALFAAAVLLLRRVPRRAVFALVLAGSAVIGGAALTGPPNLSTDSARYAWDGIVQNAGISPYAYAPTSKHLRDLRPEWLFPTPGTDSSGDATCSGPRIQKSHEPRTDITVCTALNRGSYPTIYPPTAELLFAGVRALVPVDAEYWPMQAAGLVIDLGIVWMLLIALRRRGRDPRWAALFGWCPFVATEAVTNSHVDVLGAIFLLAATLLVSTGRRWTGGIALGAAIAAKLIPVIGAPALLRRQPWKVVFAAIAVFLLLYVPYIAQSGVKVLGYLPRYLTEEGYDDGTRFALITPFVRGTGALAVAAVLLVILAVLVWRKTDPSNPWLGQTVMIGMTLIIVSPRYAWYALLLVPMIAMTGRWEWLAIPLALTARELEPYVAVTRFGELAALILIIAVSIWRSGPGWTGRVVDELRHPFRAQAAISRR